MAIRSQPWPISTGPLLWWQSKPHAPKYLVAHGDNGSQEVREQTPLIRDKPSVLGPVSRAVMLGFAAAAPFMGTVTPR